METFSALLAICAGNSPVPGEFPAQRPVTRSFDVFFDLRLNKQLSKQSWRWWFETLSRPLWHHRNDSHWNCFRWVPQIHIADYSTLVQIMASYPYLCQCWPRYMPSYGVTRPKSVKTHWGRAKMVTIFQTTVSNWFSWMKMYGFWLKFRWSLFPRVQLILF